MFETGCTQKYTQSGSFAFRFGPSFIEVRLKVCESVLREQIPIVSTESIDAEFRFGPYVMSVASKCEGRIVGGEFRAIRVDVHFGKLRRVPDGSSGAHAEIASITRKL
jgi:hypothetical protein